MGSPSGGDPNRVEAERIATAIQSQYLRSTVEGFTVFILAGGYLAVSKRVRNTYPTEFGTVVMIAGRPTIVWGVQSASKARPAGQGNITSSGELECPECHARILDEPGPLKCGFCSLQIRE
jgi:hypothetical protein